MAVPTKTNPVGIDVGIEDLRAYLNSNLWTTDNYDSYGRCYKLTTEDGISPHVFTGGTGNDYQLLYDVDKVDAFSFFSVGDSRPIGEKFSADVDLIVFVNTETIYSTVTHRADEEAKNTVYQLIDNYGGDFEITGITDGLAPSLTGFVLPVNFKDYEPYHIFRISMNHNYIYNTDC